MKQLENAPNVISRALTDFQRDLHRRTPGDPFGKGFKLTRAWCDIEQEYPDSPASAEYRRNPSGKGKPYWQRGLFRLFQQSVAFYQEGHERGSAEEEQRPHREITHDVSFLIEVLGSHLASILPAEGLTLEEFSDLLGITPDEIWDDHRRAYLPMKWVHKDGPQSERWGLLVHTEALHEMLIAWTHH